MTDTKPYLSDIAMRIALRLDELEDAHTVEKAEAICDILSEAHPEPVNEPAEVEREAAIGAAYDFIKPKLLELSREKGPVGVWSAGYRSGWDAALRAASIPKVEPGVKVKPLNWGEHNGYHADSIVGTYHVRHDGDEPEEWSWSRNGGMHHYFATQGEAQAAAQANYEQRILSALSLSTIQGSDDALLDELIATGAGAIMAPVSFLVELRDFRLAYRAAPQPAPIVTERMVRRAWTEFNAKTHTTHTDAMRAALTAALQTKQESGE